MRSRGIRNMNIGQRIKKLREDEHLSQLELAKIINVCNTTVSQYENGSRTPSDDIKIKLANYFNVSTDYLLGLSDNEKEPTQEEWDSLTDTQKLIIELMGKLPPEQQDELVRQARYQLWLLLQKDAEQ